MFNQLQNVRKKDGLYALFSLAFIVSQVWLDLKLPDYMSEITSLVQTEGSRMGEILTAGGMMMLCALGSLVSAFVAGFFAARIAAGVSMRLREQVFQKVLSFSMEEMGRFSTASLITRSTNDITQIQMMISMGLQATLKAPILAVWAVCKISGKSWQWTGATGAAVGVLLVLLVTVFALVVPKFTKIQKMTDSLNRIMRENLTGIRVVRAYNAERYQEEKFAKASGELTDTNLFTGRVMAFMQPGMSLIMNGLTLAIYWVGVYMIDAATGMEKISLFSDMIVFSSYAMQIILAFIMLTMTMVILPRAVISAKRIREVLDTAIKMKDGGLDDSYGQGGIEFRDVSFRYPGANENILHHITFTAGRGETVAFIGATGSGKSTLVNLIPRFYDATLGEILVNGHNVKDYTQEALRRKIGYVPQRAVLFGGTVASNVSYGDTGRKHSDPAMVAQSVETAQAQEFVMAMDGVYEATVAQGGSNLSGGQKQRLSIARAIYRQPEIYIFDDSFSALDYQTDRQLRAALRKETVHATTLIVAQRVGTILDADRIIVLDEGRIVGQGSHEELIKTCAVYREIAQSQMSKEEMEHV